MARDIRTRVLESTLDLLFSRGWQGVTTAAVAKGARISKKTLYRLFPSKEALLEAALEKLLRISFARLDRILGSAAPPLARIDLYLEEVIGIVSQAQQRILEQARGVSPTLWRRVEAERRKRLEALGELVREAQRQGLVRPDLDVDLWLVLLRAAVEGVINPERVLREGLSAPRAVDTLRKSLFEGILTDEGREALARYREGRGKDEDIRGGHDGVSFG